MLGAAHHVWLRGKLGCSLLVLVVLQYFEQVLVLLLNCHVRLNYFLVFHLRSKLYDLGYRLALLGLLGLYGLGGARVLLGRLNTHCANSG